MHSKLPQVYMSSIANSKKILFMKTPRRSFPKLVSNNIFSSSTQFSIVRGASRDHEKKLIISSSCCRCYSIAARRYFSAWNPNSVTSSFNESSPDRYVSTLRSNMKYQQKPWRWLNAGAQQLPTTTPATLNTDSISHPDCNITYDIVQRVGKNLHLQPNHPIHIIKQKIELFWKSRVHGIEIFDNLHPLVSTHSNFDSLLIDKDHVSRRRSDTYYFNNETVLRTHTSAHQSELLSRGLTSFLVTGDVYRRDEIDSSHYPVFHQMEGVRLLTELADDTMTLEQRVKVVEHDLKEGLEGMARELFGDVEMRWIDAYFPFTHPSFELEIFYQNEWLEVLGCGVIEPEIIKTSTRNDKLLGWAFGLGLERLAMVLFSIPDIRLFWSDDKRFLDQFASGEMNVTFVPYSKYPPCFKDISFWIPEDATTAAPFHVNDLNEGVRGIAGDLVEQVQLIDEFIHPKTGRTSHCYRIMYRSMDRNLTNEEIDLLQDRVRAFVQDELKVELR